MPQTAPDRMKHADPMRTDVERAQRQLERGADPARVLDELSQRLTNKLLHAPLRALNPAATESWQRKGRAT